MASPISNGSFRQLASRGALAAALLVTAIAPDRRAEACGWDGPSIEDLTTFDPTVADEVGRPGLAYDPFNAGFGGPCDDCARTAMIADWTGYLGGTLTAAQFDQLAIQATSAELAALRKHLAGRGPVPPALATIAAAAQRQPAVRTSLLRAVDYIAFSRQVAALPDLTEAAPARSKIAPLLTTAATAVAAATKVHDGFLAQRYAFLQLRITFYGRDWKAAVTLFDTSSAVLARPSADLAARARYYAAGALRRSGELARANLELARVHVESPALSGMAAQDFQPMEDADWRKTLALAKNLREQTQLWRLVGLKLDGLVAAQEIVKLAPTSDLLGLLVVRELARAESSGADTTDPSVLAAQQQRYAALEQLALTIAKTPGADRPWLMQLVAGHLAARRGDLAGARSHLGAAVKARAGDPDVVAQAQASLALALAVRGNLSAPLADELARAILSVPTDFGRVAQVTTEVRLRLATAALKAGQPVEAEFLTPGTVDAAGGTAPSKWADVGFLKEMIARTGKAKSPYDRFVLGASFSRPQLEAELAMRHVLDGRLAAAAKAFNSKRAASNRLGTDPFVMHIVDCHDCDHVTYASASWTHASVVARMAKLEQQARGKGDAAARAALELGNAYYNLTWYGNARVFLESSHQATSDTGQALRWYQAAFDSGKDRELKAKAAFFAAKAELHGLLAATYRRYDGPEALPVPTTWYPIVKQFANTSYYRDILAECGTYQAWSTTRP